MSVASFMAIAWLQTVLSGVVAYFALRQFQEREKYVRLIGLLFLVGCTSNTVTMMMYYLGIHNGNIAQTLYTITAFLIMSALYYLMLGKKNLNWFLGVSIVCTFLFFLNLIFLQKTSINSYTNALSGFFILLYALIYFLKLIAELPTTEFRKLPMFWFNSAMLMFYSGTFFLFVVNAYMINVLNSTNIEPWVFHNVLSIIEHVIILVGLYHERRVSASITQPLQP